MKIRAYSPSDVEQLAALFTVSVHRLAAPYYDEAQLSAWAPAQHDLFQWNSRFLKGQTIVAEGAAAIAGFIAFEADGHIDLLYTHPAFARRGVASLLYAQAEQVLTDSGITEIFTEASLAARPFFESNGFQVVEEQNVSLRGASFRRFSMRKSASAVQE